MPLSSIYAPGKLGLSFELYPPKTPKGEAALYRHVEQLMALKPSFITCTYGAGGSTRGKTLEIISQVRQRFELPVASHLTCVGSTKDELRDYLTRAMEAGVEHIIALRGDPPQGETSFRPVEGGLQYANDLVEMIRDEFPQFGIAVAGYPETHREAISPESDLDHLKRKVDAGADVVITQLFYNNEDFFRFRDRYAAAGIAAPLIPGILPVTSLAQIQRISSMCQAAQPQELIDRLSEKDDKSWQFQVGVNFASQQVRELLKQEVPGVHFFVLNRSQASLAVQRAVEQL